jgi:hypothetical protein
MRKFFAEISQKCYLGNSNFVSVTKCEKLNEKKYVMIFEFFKFEEST